MPKFFLSGNVPYLQSKNMLLNQGNVLCSFGYWTPSSITKIVNDPILNSCMIDSGAFTAWTKGKHIDLNAYAELLLALEPKIEMAVTLDEIPGQFGRKPSMKELEQSTRAGWGNTLFLMEKGYPKSKLMPVFHQGEDIEWLELFHSEGFSYIGISPANDSSQKEKEKWLRNIAPFCVDIKGRCLAKYHGLAVTSLKTIACFPWYSVDSATPLLTAFRNERVLLDIGHSSIMQMRVSNKKKEHDTGDFELLPVLVQTRIKELMVEVDPSFSWEKLNTCRVARCLFNWKVMHTIVEEMPPPIVTQHQKGLFF